MTRALSCFTVILILSLLAACTKVNVPEATSVPEVEPEVTDVELSLQSTNTIVVSGTCTLIDAINAANTDTAVGDCSAGSGEDTIELEAGATYTLTAIDNTTDTGDNGLPVITSQIIINGNGAIIERSSAAGTPYFRIIENQSHFTLNEVTIRNGILPVGAGGGIYNNAELNLTNSTVSRNFTRFGGGIYNTGTLNLTNSTVSGNSASTEAGGIFNDGTLNLTNSTVSRNSTRLPSNTYAGGGINNSGTLNLTNSIIADNTGMNCLDNFSTINDNGYNLVEDGTCISASTSISGDPKLGALADNGGPTFTHALLFGSIALDAGDCSGDSIDKDQRGEPRPQGSGCDIGAYEGFIPDTTPPVIKYKITGTQGNNNWYTSNVIVDFTCTDDSGIATDVSDQTLSNDGANQSASSGDCTDNAGNTANSVTVNNINIDKTAPIASASGTLGNNNWYISDVTVSFTGSDSLSGLASCDTDVVLNSDGTNQSASGTCTDNAGNKSEPATVTGINIDKTTPVISHTRTPANSHGWNNSDVTLDFSCTDSGSGVATDVSDTTLTNEGENQSASSGECIDNAGNTANSVTVDNINIDKTLPTASASASGIVGNNNWYISAVTVSFSGNDNLSGIANCAADIVLDSDGADQSASGTCSDLAGNKSLVASVTDIDIDTTSPNLIPTVSPNPVILYASASASANASDDTSGIATENCDAVDTSSVGSHTVNCTATDNAGNVSSADASYSVIYDYSGFFSPVNSTNNIKAGRTIPIKFSLNGDQGLNIIAVGYPTSRVCGSTTERATNSNRGLSYNAGNYQYNYGWKTEKSWKKSCREFVLVLDDGTEHTATFNFK